MTEVSVKFMVPSHPRYLSLVRAAVGELASVSGYPPEECRAVILAVDEALANIIRHAYRGDFERPIQVECQAYPDHLQFDIFDEGEPPDPARLEPHPVDEFALSGRGTHIIRSIMDEVRYERTSGKNWLRLTKHLREAEPGDGEGRACERYNS